MQVQVLVAALMASSPSRAAWPHWHVTAVGREGAKPRRDGKGVGGKGGGPSAHTSQSQRQPSGRSRTP